MDENYRKTISHNEWISCHFQWNPDLPTNTCGWQWARGLVGPRIWYLSPCGDLQTWLWEIQHNEAWPESRFLGKSRTSGWLCCLGRDFIWSVRNISLHEEIYYWIAVYWTYDISSTISGMKKSWTRWVRTTRRVIATWILWRRRLRSPSLLLTVLPLQLQLSQLNQENPNGQQQLISTQESENSLHPSKGTSKRKKFGMPRNSSAWKGKRRSIKLYENERNKNWKYIRRNGRRRKKPTFSEPFQLMVFNTTGRHSNILNTINTRNQSTGTGNFKTFWYSIFLS